MTQRGTPEADAQRAIVRALRVVLSRGSVVHHPANEVTSGDRRARQRPYTRNAKIHSTEQVARIAASMTVLRRVRAIS